MTLMLKRVVLIKRDVLLRRRVMLKGGVTYFRPAEASCGGSKERL